MQAFCENLPTIRHHDALPSTIFLVLAPCPGTDSPNDRSTFPLNGDHGAQDAAEQTMPSTGQFIPLPAIDLPLRYRFFRRVNKHSQDGGVCSGKNRGYLVKTRLEHPMSKVAVIEDDIPTIQ